MRQLLQATVQAVNDDVFIYPCCPQCYTKLSQETDRCSSYCFKCSRVYQPGQFNHRYRLSLQILVGSRKTNIVAFGKCLQGVFGLPANDFQGFLASNVDSMTPELVHSAVHSCLVGIPFYFAVAQKPIDNKSHVNNKETQIGTLLAFHVQCALPEGLPLAVVDCLKLMISSAAETGKCPENSFCVPQECYVVEHTTVSQNQASFTLSCEIDSGTCSTQSTNNDEQNMTQSDKYLFSWSFDEVNVSWDTMFDDASQEIHNISVASNSVKLTKSQLATTAQGTQGDLCFEGGGVMLDSAEKAFRMGSGVGYAQNHDDKESNPCKTNNYCLSTTKKMKMDNNCRKSEGGPDSGTQGRDICPEWSDKNCIGQNKLKRTMTPRNFVEAEVSKQNLTWENLPDSEDIDEFLMKMDCGPLSWEHDNHSKKDKELVTDDAIIQTESAILEGVSSGALPESVSDTAKATDVADPAMTESLLDSAIVDSVSDSVVSVVESSAIIETLLDTVIADSLLDSSKVANVSENAIDQPVSDNTQVKMLSDPSIITNVPNIETGRVVPACADTAKTKYVPFDGMKGTVFKCHIEDFGQSSESESYLNSPKFHKIGESDGSISHEVSIKRDIPFSQVDMFDGCQSLVIDDNLETSDTEDQCSTNSDSLGNISTCFSKDLFDSSYKSVDDVNPGNCSDIQEEKKGNLGSSPNLKKEDKSSNAIETSNCSFVPDTQEMIVEKENESVDVSSTIKKTVQFNKRLSRQVDIHQIDVQLKFGDKRKSFLECSSRPCIKNSQMSALNYLSKVNTYGKTQTGSNLDFSVMNSCDSPSLFSQSSNTSPIFYGNKQTNRQSKLGSDSSSNIPKISEPVNVSSGMPFRKSFANPQTLQAVTKTMGKDHSPSIEKASLSHSTPFFDRSNQPSIDNASFHRALEETNCSFQSQDLFTPSPITRHVLVSATPDLFEDSGLVEEDICKKLF